MTWWALDVRTIPGRRESVGAWLVARTGHAVEEREDGTLVAFAEDEATARRLEAVLAAALPPVATARRPVATVDWSTRWRDGLVARHIGRLTVTPSWISEPSPGTGPVLVVDPESAFGSGEHGSTRAALALLERYVGIRDRVLDLGSGSGILAIAAVLLGARRATGVEADAEANEVARRNAERNGVADRVTFLHGDAALLAPLLGPCEVIVANILRGTNAALLPVVRAAGPAGGLAIFAGMEEAEAELFRPMLGAAGFTAAEDIVDAGWWAVAARAT